MPMCNFIWKIKECSAAVGAKMLLQFFFTFLAHFNAIFVSKTATKVVSTDASSPNAEIGHFSVIFRLSDHPEVTWSS